MTWIFNAKIPPTKNPPENTAPDAIKQSWEICNIEFHMSVSTPR